MKQEQTQLPLTGKLIQIGDMRDTNGDPVRGVLIECSMDDLRDCNLNIYGLVSVYNMEGPDGL